MVRLVCEVQPGLISKFHRNLKRVADIFLNRLVDDKMPGVVCKVARKIVINFI